MAATIDFSGELFQPGSPVTPVIREAALKARTFGLALVKARTPVDTGELKGNWQATLEGNGIRWSNPTPYSAFVEFGTRKMKPRYMLTNSLVDIAEVFEREIAKGLGKSIGAKIVSSLVGTPDQPTYQNQQNAPSGGGFKLGAFNPRVAVSKNQQNFVKAARPLWQKKAYAKDQIGVFRV